jgi:prolipoprotein diacylglyceryltransferase/protein-S-isoprenylcysteine O-methyltransferase Ste14
MVMRGAIRIGPLLYGTAWAAVAPALLVAWAVATADMVPLQAVHAPVAGAGLALAGLTLLAAGIHALAVHGGGLPMNAYPPPRFVATGVYAWISHPIYVGFVVLAFGASLATGSASGLWLVSPVAALALTALVLGYERHDLLRRFGPRTPPRIALPAARPGTASTAERISIYLLVLLPWLLAYEALHVIGVPRDAIVSHLPFEDAWPVVEWTEIIYVSAYAMILATPFLVRSRQALRQFAVTGLLATAIVTFIYVLVPLIAPPRPFEPTTLAGRLLAVERSLSNTVAAFPAFHVIWPLIATQAWLANGRRWGLVAAAWTLLIAASCITTGMHSLVDVVAAFAIFPLLSRAAAAWELLRRLAERTANSWQEWRVGSIRIINHGFYAAAGGAVGTWIAAVVVGPELAATVVAIALFTLVVSALWAQFIEGSPMLLRPLGFYGGIVGGLAALAVLPVLGVAMEPVLLGFTLAMPWVQAAGRLRCLVQGCCHGGPAPPAVGIRYGHSRSRVTQIAGLAGTAIHPTPLYSLLANVVTGLLLFRLQLLGASVGIIAGLYFILNGLARFVEESYRAEPQTPIIAGLRLYQWIAALTFLVGVGFTTTARAALPAAGGVLDVLPLLAALAVGVAAMFITGVDFPESNRRFSRLAAADGTPRMIAMPTVLPAGARDLLHDDAIARDDAATATNNAATAATNAATAATNVAVASTAPPSTPP